ncbi:hypothetical protein TNCV_3042761 [Trichonephila clavipes]|nr:hypothetical protein TNCV_3042761 [Trichonephila clavipes]
MGDVFPLRKSRRFLCCSTPVERESQVQKYITYTFGTLKPNIEWYCKCEVSATVVGCCARVPSVVWYLGYWYHNLTQTKTSSLEYTDTLQDTTTGWSSDDSASES